MKISHTHGADFVGLTRRFHGLQSIASAESTVTSATGTLGSKLPDVRADSVGRIQSFETKSKPTVDKIDKWYGQHPSILEGPACTFNII